MCLVLVQGNIRMYHQIFHYTPKTILEIINIVVGPFSITSKNWGEFNFVIEGSLFVMLHHLALLPYSVVDGKFPSENHLEIVSPKNQFIFGGFGLKRY